MELARLPRTALETMAEAGREVLECRRVLAKSGATVLDEVMRGAVGTAEWTHYPEGDVYDPESHAQFFYHVHPPAQHPPREHGHFHTFLRPRGMAPGARPLMMPELAIADAPAAPAGPAVPPIRQSNQGADNDAFSHLIGIAMDRSGAAVRLFTTNRWVTDETWYAAADVIDMLDRFVVDSALPSWALNRWISAMFRLFRPQMTDLLRRRDEAIMSWRRRHRGKVHVFEDSRLEVASSLDIDVDEQVRRVALALKQVA
ncbi:MAG TPA: hypothetical protein VET85_03565 [Stellaceae bacterium]|nr:hypothetical protein [Stellaceae bacterium]